MEKMNLKNMDQKEIIFVTGNQSKLEEAVSIAEKYPVKIIGQKIDLFEPMEVNGTQILIDKVKDAYKQIRKSLIVDDAGIYFEDYPNFPGVFTKFIIKSLNFDGIFRLLERKNREAYFKCNVGFIDDRLNNPVLFEGVCKGKIAEKVSDVFDKNFEFNSIFIPEGESRTFSEMTIGERKKYSHRAKALEKFLNWYTKEYQK